MKIVPIIIRRFLNIFFLLAFFFWLMAFHPNIEGAVVVYLFWVLLLFIINFRKKATKEKQIKRPNLTEKESEEFDRLFAKSPFGAPEEEKRLQELWEKSR